MFVVTAIAAADDGAVATDLGIIADLSATAAAAVSVEVRIIAAAAANTTDWALRAAAFERH